MQQTRITQWYILLFCFFTSIIKSPPFKVSGNWLCDVFLWVFHFSSMGNYIVHDFCEIRLCFY